MQSVKALNLLDTAVTTHATWSDVLYETLNRRGIDAHKIGLEDGVRLLLQADGGVKNVDDAMHALQWIGLLSENGGNKLQASTPLDSLCRVMEQKLSFSENERDMVAMFHTVVGRMPDGTVERHTSRLLDFGESGHHGDSAMSKTVGYTTGAAAELLLIGAIKAKGVVIPTSQEVYEPMLNRLKDFGITWTENIEIH